MVSTMPTTVSSATASPTSTNGGAPGFDGCRKAIVAALADNEVADLVMLRNPAQLLAFREEVGEFGELVYAGLDWVDPTLARRSMELMAQKVMPDVNAALA